MGDSYRTGWHAVLFSLLLVATLSNGDMTRASESEGSEAFAQVLLHNDYVKVVGLRLSPGSMKAQKNPQHRVIYALSSHSIRHAFDNGVIREHEFSAGEVHWVRSGTVNIRNIGDSTARFIEFRSLVTPFDPDPPGPSSHELGIRTSIAEVAPDQASILLENDHFRVIEYIIGQGEMLPEHLTTNHVVLSLVDLAIRYIEQEKEPYTKRMGEMDIAWHQAGNYALQNMAPREANFITVEVKPPQRYTDYEP
ncbi:hypothetical protein [Halomonas sp. LBP4]|uniref:hypothetical protein n=1 Tax=Halomonas sp. LBP4 TaxID=2044917 RepID=UPI0011B60730|nr:hypothetical protein [Halomonas sp. LBP4]